jgi:hypothetical protein
MAVQNKNESKQLQRARALVAKHVQQEKVNAERSKLDEANARLRALSPKRR